MLAALGIVGGLLLLIGGGAALVSGASQIAQRFGVSPMIVGLTIIGFGTSSPELVINLLGALRGETDLAFGNVVGSNISNLALVLGATAAFKAIELHGTIVRREVPFLLLVTAITTVMALDGYLDGTVARIGRSDAIILLLLFAIFLYISVNDVLRDKEQDRLIAEIETSPVVIGESKKNLAPLLVVGGFALLFAGGELTVASSVTLAERLGISTAIVGLFIVAVGTSMPELVTSIIAAIRGESDLALGNIVGSNLFNSLVVMPAAGIAGDILIPEHGIFDLVVSLAFAAILIPVFIFGAARLTRQMGIVLLIAYFSYLIFRVSA